MKEAFVAYIRGLQDQICQDLEDLDGEGRFREDHWERPGGGGGRSRVLQKGAVFEKGGVSTSEVYGALSESLKTQMPREGAAFYATGISLVIHPQNPFVPTVHANYRYFELYDENGTVLDAWIGGGTDLTPYYLDREDARHFHRCQKEAAAPFGDGFYPRFKAQCDAYFYNHHRQEARGIGGTFYDHLRPGAPESPHDLLAFQKAMGNSFLPGYLPLVEKQRDKPYGDAQRYWQELRRGRYVEFNLVHDRGTLFGLKSQGRTESILMSLPPRVRWDYDHQPAPGSPEAELLTVLRQPVDWIKEKP